MLSIVVHQLMLENVDLNRGVMMCLFQQVVCQMAGIQQDCFNRINYSSIFSNRSLVTDISPVSDISRLYVKSMCFITEQPICQAEQDALSAIALHYIHTLCGKAKSHKSVSSKPNF